LYRCSASLFFTASKQFSFPFSTIIFCGQFAMIEGGQGYGYARNRVTISHSRASVKSVSAKRADPRKDLLGMYKTPILRVSRFRSCPSQLCSAALRSAT
jgi:hypothetical protein